MGNYKMINDRKFVSIIIPCRNEVNFIASCLDSIIANDYPKEFIEVLVIDGMSEDGTREIINSYTVRFPFIKIIDNAKKITPVAFNLGIKQAKGNVIVIMSAHATYDDKYLLFCIKYLDEYNADNVGGLMITKPRNNTIIDNVIVQVLAHPFGVGNAIFRTGAQNIRWVDTVFGGCYRREVFDKIGIFNEKLERSQDMEFNRRLQMAGGKILFVPEIISYYYPRSGLFTFCKNNFSNGYWVTYPFKFTSIIPVSLRHLIPLLFVSTIIILSGLSYFAEWAIWMLIFVIGLYFLASAISSSCFAIKGKKAWYLILMPVMFFVLHFSYGLGSLWGVIKLVTSKHK